MSDLARDLVFEYGWNSTSHQVLDPGIRHWFSAAGDAVVGYVEVAGMRIVAGAPVASDDRLAAVAAEFEGESLAAGRHVCYFAAENRLLSEAKHRRYASHLIGLQPTWSSDGWAQRFDASASLRAQRNRARNKGVRVEEAAPHSERDADLRACHSAWLASKGAPPLRFMAHSDLSGADEAVAEDRRLFIARQDTQPSRVVGYLSLAPVPRRRGWLVEKIIRHPRAPNGTAELLVDTALRSLAESSERFTLGLAPLLGVGGVDLADKNDAAALAGGSRPPVVCVDSVPQESQTPGWLRLAERVALKRGRKVYDFAGLNAFKGKFQPDAWEPVYLLSTQKRLTPRTFIALAGAFLGTYGCQPRGQARRSQVRRSPAQPAPAQRGWWSMPS